MNEAKFAQEIRNRDVGSILHTAQHHLLFLQSAFSNTTYSTLQRRDRFAVCTQVCEHIAQGEDFKLLPDRVLSVIYEIESEGAEGRS